MPADSASKFVNLNDSNLEEQWLISWLQERIGAAIEIDPKLVDVEFSFFDYGIDSALAVGLIGDLARRLSVEIDPSAFYDFPSIRKLARHLVQSSEVTHAVQLQRGERSEL